MLVPELTLPLTLEELHLGCTKRRQPRPNGPIHNVEVKAGNRPGDKIKLEEITYVVAQREHERFSRIGDDLHTHLKVPLGEALTGFETQVKAIDGEEITVANVDILKPGDTTIIPYKGMNRRHNGRGDLIIHFEVIFPNSLLDEEKLEIHNILSRVKHRVNRAPSMFNLRARAFSDEGVPTNAVAEPDEFRSIGSWGLTLGRRFSRDSKMNDDNCRRSRDSGTTRNNARMLGRRHRTGYSGNRKFGKGSNNPAFNFPRLVVQKLFNRKSNPNENTNT